MIRLFPAALAALVITPAWGKDLAGAVGVGADASFSGGPGAHITYWANDRFAVQGTVGLYLDDDTTAATVGGGVVYNFVTTERANLGGQLAGSVTAPDGDRVWLQAGLRPELFATDQLSFHATVGAALILTDGSTAFAFATNGLVGSAGFTWYFTKGAKGAAQ